MIAPLRYQSDSNIEAYEFVGIQREIEMAI
jgi:hypothetical protein